MEAFKELAVPFETIIGVPLLLLLLLYPVECSPNACTPVEPKA